MWFEYTWCLFLGARLIRLEAIHHVTLYEIFSTVAMSKGRDLNTFLTNSDGPGEPSDYFCSIEYVIGFFPLCL